MILTANNGDTFRFETDLIEATSLHRPDTSWRFVDAAGHEHRWYYNGVPAPDYVAGREYSTPTLKWVKDGEEYWPDDDQPHDVGHHECIACGEHVEKGYTADTNRVFMPGLRRCYINDQSVSPDEFERRAREAGLFGGAK